MLVSGDALMVALRGVTLMRTHVALNHPEPCLFFSILSRAGDLLNDPGITPTAVKLLVALVDMESPENLDANAKGHDGVYGVAEGVPSLPPLPPPPSLCPSLTMYIFLFLYLSLFCRGMP